MASGENSVSLFKGVRFMVPFPLVNSQWLLVEQLNLGKFFAHIKSMIIFIKPLFSDVVTEVWDFVERNNKVIPPNLPQHAYYYGIAFFPVNIDFCKK